METKYHENILVNAIKIDERIKLYSSKDSLKIATSSIVLSEEDLNKYRSQLSSNTPYLKFLWNSNCDEPFNEDIFLKILSDDFLRLIIDQNIRFGKWATHIIDLYNNYQCDGSFFSKKFENEVELSGFFNCFEPLIRNAIEKLQAKFSKIMSISEKEKENILRELCNNIAFTLFDISDRTLVLELNIQKMMDMLEGQSPKDRFNSFVENLNDDVILNQLIADYPILFRKVYEFLNTWVDNSFTFTERLISDYQMLRDKLNVGHTARVKKLHINAGDRHQGNQTVIIITFDDDSKVVYKPRSLAIDNRFQKLLNWFNEKGLQHPLKRFEIIDKNTYGWCEFVSFKECETNDELQCYYHRIGSLLAILYLINATDFHYENIIANGEHPVLIDLESLFHSKELLGYDGVDQQINHILTSSVLNIQILPFKLYTDHGVVDISGVVDLDGKESPVPTAVWQAAATDEMKLTRIKMQMKAGKNAPKKAVEKNSLIKNAQYIEDGFREAYRIIIRDKEALLAPVGPLKQFDNDEIRILLRGTANYSNLIRISFHPDFLQKENLREPLWLKLVAKRNDRDTEMSIQSYERNALINMDVPLFNTRPSSRNLYSGETLLIEDFFPASGIDSVISKLNYMSETDMERQCWFINASVAASVANHSDLDLIKAQKTEFSISKSEVKNEKLESSAILIYNKLDNLSIKTDDVVHWASIVLSDGINFDIRPLMLDLYSGLPGVLIFLSALSTQSNDRKHAEMLQQCYNNIVRLTNRYISLDFREKSGAFDGWAGIIYALDISFKITGKEQFLEYRNKCLKFFLNKSIEVATYDLLGGYAGIALVLSKIYNDTPDQEILDRIHSIGHTLVSESKSFANGIAWTNAENSPALTGLAHGTAGIALALSKIFQLTGDDVFRRTSLQAIEFENSNFIAKSGNWLDKRDFRSQSIDDQIETDMVAWCHGATGIGLSRLGIINNLQATENQILTNDLDIALKTVIDRGFGGTHSLCHGDFGNLELLLQASKFYKQTSYYSFAKKISSALLSEIEENRIVSGVPLGVVNPGFMVGISGIGYQMLRILHPERYPSILTLD